MNLQSSQIVDQFQLNPQTSTDYCFTIEGNIGCGKSTFLQLLRRKVPEAKWIQQPVNQWQNLGGKDINILQKYYQQPTRWGFTFQTYAIYTRVKALNQACQMYPNKLKISQRSILADKYVFSQLMKDLGYMDQSQYQVFKSLYQNFEKMIPIQKTKIIYLRCSPEKCHQRTKIRQRSQESSIPLQYLKMIHQKHQDWFNQYDNKNVLIIDTTENFKDNDELIQEMLRKLKSFINED